MNSIKRLVIPLAAASILPSGILAEGLERVNIDPSFMFESGSYAEVSYGSSSPSIPAAVTGLGTIDNVAETVTATTFAVKTAIGDKIDFGLWSTSNGNGVNLDWGNAIGITADLSMPTMAAMVRYRLSDSMSIIGGLKRVSIDNGSSVSLPITAAGITTGTWTLSSASATTSVYGIVNEIPSIAMRMTVLMEGAAALDIDTNYSQTVGGVTTAYTGVAKASVGDATTISLQTGIAPNTLLFGSLKLSNWKDDQVQIPLSGTAARATISTFEDGQSYTIGLGRKFSDNLSGSASYFRDPASDCDSVSALSPKCETSSISLGAKYSINDRATLSLGTTWTQYGDATVGAPAATTTSSNQTSYGFKLGFKF
ncbi:MAG: hypothetical protein CML56_09565 [Rhodobacteraceae bacterium]|nr:hypothetical protein [Paracoccaceae bacterium]